MRSWRLWKVRDQSVLFVMAIERESGAETRERIHPLITGAGPVEATAVESGTFSL
jgi:hypothetical protein